MRKTLLTPADVIQYTPLKLPFNPCTFRELYTIEYTEAAGCLGVEFWQAMTEAKADYSSAEAYEAGTIYTAGDVVVWRGGYRVATAMTTQSPDYAAEWDDAPRFAGDGAEAYDDLFCTFLAPFLAYVVLSQRLPYIISQATDQGIDYGGRQYNAQDKARIESLERAVYRDRELAFKALDLFLKSDEARQIVYYEKYKPIAEADDAAGCGCKKPTCKKCARPGKVGGYRFGNIS